MNNAGTGSVLQARVKLRFTSSFNFNDVEFKKKIKVKWNSRLRFFFKNNRLVDVNDTQGEESLLEYYSYVDLCHDIVLNVFSPLSIILSICFCCFPISLHYLFEVDYYSLRNLNIIRISIYIPHLDSFA